MREAIVENGFGIYVAEAAYERNALRGHEGTAFTLLYIGKFAKEQRQGTPNKIEATGKKRP